ncbi:hypothetical protein N331_02008 [Merops nubicus]|nr:hypothetical protein N331_02008 [Merops nubicus]
MPDGHRLSGSGSHHSQPKLFPPETSSSYSSSALTMEKVKKLEEEYLSSKEAFQTQRIQDYIRQTNLALFNKETLQKEAEPEGASSSFPAQ